MSVESRIRLLKFLELKNKTKMYFQPDLTFRYSIVLTTSKVQDKTFFLLSMNHKLLKMLAVLPGTLASVST